MIQKIIWYFQNKCTKCGTRKIDWRGVDACPYCDLIPPFKNPTPTNKTNQL